MHWSNTVRSKTFEVICHILPIKKSLKLQLTLRSKTALRWNCGTLMYLRKHISSNLGKLIKHAQKMQPAHFSHLFSHYHPLGHIRDFFHILPHMRMVEGRISETRAEEKLQKSPQRSLLQPSPFLMFHNQILSWPKGLHSRRFYQPAE